ncbi:hypothetical protein D9M70_627160 [compost metagenome]
MVPRVQAQGLGGHGRQFMAFFAQTRFDAFDDLSRLIVPTMDHQPARAFRQPQAHHQDHQAQHGTDAKAQAPAQVAADHLRVQQDDGPAGAQRGA